MHVTKVNKRKVLPLEQRGFTLVELLIAISLIAILSGVLFSVINPRGIQAKARDSQRVSDLTKIKVALENYFADNRSYPTYATWTVVDTVAGLSSNYINVLPKDPKQSSSVCASGTWREYYYKTDSTGSMYVLATNNEVSAGQACSSLPSSVQATCSASPAPCSGGTLVYYTTAD